jgi:translation initiation factor 2 beta subunit (eIF-2beta)/eIF-5
MNHLQTLRIIMKIREVIEEFVPCEICGNSDIKNFYFHVLVDKGSLPYVKCCECEEEYYSARAKNILTRVKESRRERTGTTFGNKEDLINQESLHPLVKVLAKI